MRIEGRHLNAPGHWYEDGNRWVATDYGWNLIRKYVIEQAKGKCEKCGKEAQYLDIHHRFGRGGGKRDDRPVLGDGTKNLLALCRFCHSETPIERRYVG